MKLLLLPPRPPAKPVMLCTAGSASTTLRSASSLGTVAWNEVPWSTRKKPSSWPVSCCGKKPLGTTAYR